MDIRPIGIFDSGSGGLSVRQSVIQLLPHESTIYIGDHAYVPYGTKSGVFIKNRTSMAIAYLLGKHCKAIIIACNTATVAGIDYFRKKFPDVPIVGVVPVIKTASSVTKTGTYIILSTSRTAKSVYQKKLIHEFSNGHTVVSIGSSDLVSQVEKGDCNTKETLMILRRLLTPKRLKGVDSIVLGCTHFPFLRQAIAAVAGNNIRLLDSGDAVARQIKRILEGNAQLSGVRKPAHVFLTTGNIRRVEKTVRKLLGRAVVVRQAAIS